MRATAPLMSGELIGKPRGARAFGFARIAIAN
jgi:hypothetical protein